MTTSICPIPRSTVNSHTPIEEPRTPPASRVNPILMSTLRRRQWASTPDTDEATIWLASVATATAGGIPIKISSGVIRNPPPTPNSPDRNPTAPPMPKIMKTLTDNSAMGR